MSSLVDLYRELPGKMITFDLTGLCNLSCSMCVWHNGRMKDAPKKHLDFEKFKLTIDELVENKIGYDCINLSVSGEPTIHPKFKEIVKYLFENNEGSRLFHILSINTNMVPLTKKTADFLLDLLQQSDGQLFLTCSINSASEEASRKIKQSDCFKAVEENTQYIVRQKAERRLGNKLKLDLQCIVLEENHHEIEKFIQFWSLELDATGMPYRVVADEFCSDDVTINIKREFDKDRQVRCDELFAKGKKIVSKYQKEKSASAPAPAEAVSVRPQRPFVVAPQHAEEFGTKAPCPALWLTPIVRSDGVVSTCLSDIDAHMQIGGINNQKFLSTWLGDKANENRLWHLKGKSDNISVCSHCTYYQANGVSRQNWQIFGNIMKERSEKMIELEKRIKTFNAIPKKILTFDLTNVCNLGCFYCTFTQEDKHAKKKKRYMSVDQLKKVCNELIMHGSYFDTICLSVSGEPTLNPWFKDIIKYLFEMNTESRRFFRYISINTNVTFLDKEKVDLINHYVSKGHGEMQLTLSINSASRETFVKTKKVDEWDKTIENTKYILAEKARLDLGFKYNLYLLFLVNEHVEHEAEVFRDYWSAELERLGLSYEVSYALPSRESNVIIYKRTYANEGLFTLSQKEYDDMHRNVTERMGLKPKEEKVDKAKNIPIYYTEFKKTCGSPWISPIVRHDGTLNFCLTDVDNLMPIGNVFEQSFFDLWLSDASEKLRMKHINQSFKDYDMCKNCNYFDGIKVADNIIEEYKKSYPTLDSEQVEEPQQIKSTAE